MRRCCGCRLRVTLISGIGVGFDLMRMLDPAHHVCGVLESSPARYERSAMPSRGGPTRPRAPGIPEMVWQALQPYLRIA